ncbi:MAG: hypothetical protein EP326_13420 [Deltaproteobacteria bacterium]|nr:MAG: hypothetical protein EP326_13420 [Deltaproteobacteria bacterium]TNF27822.1 MAG: hypothetical protein EP319_10550 [Deltaproteobacteria bacterium]
MKALILFLSLMLSLGLEAACYDKLIAEPPFDSKSFFVQEALYEVDAQELNESSSVHVVEKLLRDRIGCEEKSLSRGVEVSCKELMPGKSWSKVCYVESEMGYFVIQMDMMEGAHVIFNRWD